MNSIGIDCGKDGAICLLGGSGILVEFHDMPTLLSGSGGKRDYDTLEMARLLRTLADGQPTHVFIEKQQAMPAELHGRKQGNVSAFQTGLGYGAWLGVVAALGLPHTLVHPLTWKKAMLSDMPKVKEASTARALQLFPQAAGGLKRKKDHNRAEALLIAEWGRRKLAGSVA